MITALDFETSRFPDGSPYRTSSQAVSWAASWQTNAGPGSVFSYYTDPNFTTSLQDVINESTTLVGVNFKFDIGWLRRSGANIKPGTRIWDCQLGEFILSGQTNSFASMEDLCSLYGVQGKQGGLEDWWNNGVETRAVPRAIVEAYNLGDVSRTLSIRDAQLADARMSPQLEKLIYLQGADMLVLQQMEENGILYDSVGSRAAGDAALEEINKIKEELNELVQLDDWNPDSGDHVSCLLYGGVVAIDRYEPVALVYKSGPRTGQAYTQQRFVRTDSKVFPGLFRPLPRTALKKPGYYQTGEPVLRQLPTRTKEQKRVVQSLLRLGDLSKQVGSFLHALPALIETQGWEIEDSGRYGTLHPQYNQVVARTGRLSCSKPNAQQFDEVTDQFWKSRYA